MTRRAIRHLLLLNCASIARSQLWRRGPNEQLVHEGSSPPQPTDALCDDTALSPHALVSVANTYTCYYPTINR